MKQEINFILFKHFNRIYKIDMSYRIYEKNKINDEIKELTTNIGRSSDTIAKLRNMKVDNYVTVQMEKQTTLLNNNNERLLFLQERIEKLESGDLDEELINNAKESSNIALLKGQETILRKKEEKKVRKEDEKASKDYYSLMRKSDRESKKQTYNSAQNHFFKVNPPEWMVSDLKRMPNNEGYVFKNIWFFGEKPRHGTTSKITEANKGYKIITTWDRDYERVYRKEGRNKEQLISEKKRKPK